MEANVREAVPAAAVVLLDDGTVGVLQAAAPVCQKKKHFFMIFIQIQGVKNFLPNRLLQNKQHRSVQVYGKGCTWTSYTVCAGLPPVAGGVEEAREREGAVLLVPYKDKDN